MWLTGRQLWPGGLGGVDGTLTGPTMGTMFTVKVVGSPVATKTIRGRVQAELDRVNAQMSTYLPDSELSRFNAARTTEPVAVSPELAAVTANALRVSEISDGAFDVTIGPIVNAYGFGPGAPAAPPTAPELAELLKRVGHSKLTADTGEGTLRKSRVDVYADLSAIAKGHGVDRVATALEALGIENYFVEIGGEIRVKGHNAGGAAWTVGIERPDPTGRAVHRVIALQDVSMATSGDYRNYREVDGRRISHTIDPRTGLPIGHALASVTVIHPSCEMADAYATAINVLGPEDGYLFAEILDLAALLLVKSGGEIDEHATPAFESAYGAAESTQP